MTFYIQCIFNFFTQVRNILYTESMTHGNQHDSLLTWKEILKDPFLLFQYWLAYYLRHYLIIYLTNNSWKIGILSENSHPFLSPTQILPCFLICFNKSMPSALITFLHIYEYTYTWKYTLLSSLNNALVYTCLTLTIWS